MKMTTFLKLQQRERQDGSEPCRHGWRSILFTHDELFTGQSARWQPFSLVLPTALQDERFIVEFRFLSDEDEEVGAGWYIDDVFVR